MAFRIDSNIVVNNSRRADIEDLYLIPYTQSQLESNPGSAVGDMAYCSDANGGTGQLVFWNGTEWNISVAPPVIQSNLELYLDSHQDIGSNTRWDSSSPGVRNLFLGNSPGAQSSSTPKYRTFNRGGLLGGSNQYGTDNDQYNLNYGTNFTWEAWFRSTDIGPLVGFYGQPLTASPVQYDRFVYLDTSGKLNFGIYANAYALITTSAVFNDGNWHYFAATYDGITMNLYVNNSQAGSRTAYASDQGVFYTNIGAGRNTAWPGASNNNGNTYTDCDLSIVRLYFNKALTQSEVTNNYDADKGKFS